MFTFCCWYIPRCLQYSIESMFLCPSIPLHLQFIDTVSAFHCGVCGHIPRCLNSVVYNYSTLSAFHTVSLFHCWYIPMCPHSTAYIIPLSLNSLVYNDSTLFEFHCVYIPRLEYSNVSTFSWLQLFYCVCISLCLCSTVGIFHCVYNQLSIITLIPLRLYSTVGIFHSVSIQFSVFYCVYILLCLYFTVGIFYCVYIQLSMFYCVHVSMCLYSAPSVLQRLCVSPCLNPTLSIFHCVYIPVSLHIAVYFPFCIIMHVIYIPMSLHSTVSVLHCQKSTVFTIYPDFISGCLSRAVSIVQSVYSPLCLYSIV